MTRLDANGVPLGVPSVLNPGATFEGVLAFDANARVEGEIVGRVFGAGFLQIAPGATVEGDVAAGSILVEGAVEGKIHAHERVVVAATGAVRGQIETVALEVSEGATIEGPVIMLASAGPEQNSDPPPASPGA